jgi:glycosyltransferase XagB
MAGGEYFRSEIPSPARGGKPAAAALVAADPSMVLEKARERRFLDRLGFSKPFLATLAMRADAHGSSLEAELLADGRVKEEPYYAAMAEALGLPFLPSIDPSTINQTTAIDSQLMNPRMVRLNLPNQLPITAIVPSAANVESHKARLVRAPELASRLVVTTPSAIRDGVWLAGAARRVAAAADDLFDSAPHHSARIVLWGSQGFWLGSMLATFLGMMLVIPALMIFLLHFGLSIVYFLLLVLRGLALQEGPKLTKPTPVDEVAGQLPVYTVMVALYQESQMVGQLIDRLSRLNWPRSRLDIKLICEEVDKETIDVLKAMQLRPEYEIVIVPDHRPRTKPKALNYGLQAARGNFLVIYDAEDRPHPDQLREAYDRFRQCPAYVACLQAPLIISNGDDGWLPALFALEYSGLFRRLLPFLASEHQPMPLGGTSNHFRIEALRHAGGWDPFNVTEDADLGMRLYRFGYAAEMVTRPTLEDAPTEIGVWLGQRRRWFKGWMQTWLVMMRQPGQLTREFGLSGSVMFHMMVTGMIFSALAHPLIIAFLALCLWQMLHSAVTDGVDYFLFLLDWANIIGSYVLFALLGFSAMAAIERRRLGHKWLFVPGYWLLISYAAWRALIELRSNPFFWKKTPHRPTRKAQQAVAE